MKAEFNPREAWRKLREKGLSNIREKVASGRYTNHVEAAAEELHLLLKRLGWLAVLHSQEHGYLNREDAMELKSAFYIDGFLLRLQSMTGRISIPSAYIETYLKLKKILLNRVFSRKRKKDEIVKKDLDDWRRKNARPDGSYEVKKSDLEFERTILRGYCIYPYLKSSENLRSLANKAYFKAHEEALDDASSPGSFANFAKAELRKLKKQS